MSSITPQEIKEEFLKSKIGIAGISILSILIFTSIVVVVVIPVDTFKEWNNPGNWISYPRVAIPVWVNLFLSEKIPEHRILSTPTINYDMSESTSITS
ncbi:MAG: ABC transporter permease, partial [Nitrosarchaeum sp.]|nr:ABC transporter permease [Nitrosarchaeum sp.]